MTDTQHTANGWAGRMAQVSRDRATIMRLTDPGEPLGPAMDAVNRIPEQRLHRALGLGPADVDDEHHVHIPEAIDQAGWARWSQSEKAYRARSAPVKVRQLRNGLGRFVLRADCRVHSWAWSGRGEGPGWRWTTYADTWHHAVGSLEPHVRMHIAEYHRDLNV